MVDHTMGFSIELAPAMSDEPDNANDEGSLSTQKGGSRSAADRAA